MNEFQKARLACIIGVKALQNVRASEQAFLRLKRLVNSADHLLVSSLFHIASIRYSKPFVQTKTSTGYIRYPLRPLRKEENFDQKIHKHLLSLRNTLLAHDDLEQIEPRILFEGMSIKGIGDEETDFFVPMSVKIANKCLSHPSELDGVNCMLSHVQGALSGISNKLYEDIGKLRQAHLDFPDQANAAKKYEKTYEDDIQIAAGGSRITPPDTSNDPWLIPSEPSFSETKGGYQYEMLQLRRDYSGPE